MDTWLRSAIDYIGSWIEFQQTTFQQPGVIVAIRPSRRDRRRARVRPCQSRHRREAHPAPPLPDRLALEELYLGRHHEAARAAQAPARRSGRPICRAACIRSVAETTIAQVLSHSAGLTRDGADSGQFIDSRPYLNARELLADLEAADRDRAQHALQIFQPRLWPARPRHRSDHRRSPIAPGSSARSSSAAGLRETEPDAPLRQGRTVRARPHARAAARPRAASSPATIRPTRWRPLRASSAPPADIARFFAQLAPNARKSVLSVASRREMTRNTGAFRRVSRRYYGLGINQRQDRRLGLVRPWRRFSGLHLPDLLHPRLRARDQHPHQLHRRRGAVLDGRRHAHPARLHDRGAPDRRVRDWNGRWWTHLGRNRSRRRRTTA